MYGIYVFDIGRHSNTGPYIQLPWEKESTETDSKKKILKFPSLIICNNNMAIAFFSVVLKAPENCEFIFFCPDFTTTT